MTMSKSNSHYLYFIVLLGLAIRLIAWANTYVVNPDGTLYIHQAKAIYYGQKEALFCGYSFVANYPVMIAGRIRNSSGLDFRSKVGVASFRDRHIGPTLFPAETFL